MSSGSTLVLDYRGLRCPLPVLRARKALRRLPAGLEARIAADDPAAPADFSAFCEIAGHELLGVAARDDGAGFDIRIRTGPRP